MDQFEAATQKREQSQKIIDTKIDSATVGRCRDHFFPSRSFWFILVPSLCVYCIYLFNIIDAYPLTYLYDFRTYSFAVAPIT